MTDRPHIRCPRCGSEIMIAEGLCPTCLLTTALAVDDGPCPYEVLAPMARGRQSVMYLAQGLRGPRRYVALKVHSLRGDETQALSRYARWKPMLDRVPSAVAAKLLDVGRTPDGCLYLASEYVAGWPLSAIDAHAAGNAELRIDLTRQLVNAVAAVHRAGLAHLALEPAKVRCSTAYGPRATILGLGSTLIVDGAAPRPEPDLTALGSLLGALGAEIPARRFSSAEEMGAAIFTSPSPGAHRS